MSDVGLSVAKFSKSYYGLLSSRRRYVGFVVGVICLCVIDRYLNTLKVSFIQPYLLKGPNFIRPNNL
jgi:hypothetical protein